MAKKKELLARVRYNKGTPGVGPDEGNAYDPESFILEIYDSEDQSWSTSLITPLRRCVEFQEAKEAEFINYTFMMEIFRLQKLGYTVVLAKGE